MGCIASLKRVSVFQNRDSFSVNSRHSCTLRVCVLQNDQICNPDSFGLNMITSLDADANGLCR